MDTPIFMKAALYARVSTHDQQTLPMQLKAMREYVKKRKWKVALEVKEVGSGAKQRPQRQEVLKAARRRDVDAIIVWRLDRWGRSLADLVVTLRELNELEIGFVSLTESLDLTTAQGRMMAGVLSAFAEFEREIITERVKAGIAHARSQGKRHGRPQTSAKFAEKARKLYKRGKGLNKSAIARKLKLPRTSVIRLLEGQ